MRNYTVRLYIFLIAFLGCSALIHAQDDDPFTCFNAQEIHFPLENNDFTKSQILLKESKVNALYYLYQDKYSFWYKFIADEDIKIEFSVAPSNLNDRYRAVPFKYGGRDFCEKLINENLQPMDIERLPIFNADGSVLYKNTIQALKGDTFYISVLSLNADDCGHFLYMEAAGESLSMHAVHRPCYNFVFLDVPDFRAAKMVADDVTLDLDFGGEEEKEEPKEDSEFGALNTIEVQSKEEGFVSVGDKLVLNQVFFYTNTYALKPEADVELDQLVAFLKGNPTVEIEIQGHTANDTENITPDPNFKGQGKEWNFKGSAFELSEERAEVVKDYLIEKGIDKKRIKAAGYGDTQKRIPDATTFEEFEKNMRVEALIIKE